MKFEFGKNWASFLNTLNEQRIDVAVESLRQMLGTESLEGKTFLDAGCGSGLFSLAAMRLNAARVHSFDYDTDSVQCAETVKGRFYPSAPNWAVERGDVLDRQYVESLGEYDIVYSWGVLHHTGDMWTALDTIISPLRKPGGQLFLAIYDDWGEESQYWHSVKKRYCELPEILRLPYLIYYAMKIDVPVVFRNLRQFKHPWRHWKEYYENRGMSYWHDIVDWVGGYPYEFASQESVVQFYSERGLKLDCVVKGANNEFLFTWESTWPSP